MKTSGWILFFIWISGNIFSNELTTNQGNNDLGMIERRGDIIPSDLKFFNEKGALVTLDSLIDKPTVLSLVYFDCPGLCSPMLDGISSVIEKSDLELGKDYQIITVSFNFRDNPEKAKQKKETFLRRHSKNHAAYWMYLTGDSTNIFRLCNATGFKFKREGSNFVHPSVIIIVSPKGKITNYLYGISFIPFDFKTSIIEAQHEQVVSTFKRALQYCFSNNNSTKIFAKKITNIGGSILLFSLLFFIVILVLKAVRKNVEYI